MMKIYCNINRNCESTICDEGYPCEHLRIKSNTSVLFINVEQGQYSIYECGKAIYNAIKSSKKIDVDYMELTETNRDIPGGYEVYAFNYHPGIMWWLEERSIKKLNGLKLTFVLEIAPNKPFVDIKKDIFDVYCIIDPTFKSDERNVYALPKPLEAIKPTDTKDPEIPTIGSFGFASIEKRFEKVVDAVNEEFDTAIVKINMPKKTHDDPTIQKRYGIDYSELIEKECKKRAKKGVEVIVTRNYMSKQDLVDWCAKNTINVFLYDTNLPGLAAAPDQAIISGKPIAISEDEQFRHIRKYITPYPKMKLKTSIATSQMGVLTMRHKWAPEKFAREFELVLNKYPTKVIDDKKGAVTLERVSPFKEATKYLSKTLNGLVPKKYL